MRCAFLLSDFIDVFLYINLSWNIGFILKYSSCISEHGLVKYYRGTVAVHNMVNYLQKDQYPQG